MIKNLLGIAPKKESDGSYSPSKLALKMATSDTTDYENTSYQKYQGSQSRILVICTEQKNMKMENGKMFSTGNHPIETLVPMLHLQSAGFEFEIATPTGKPAVLEMWAFPQKDEHVNAIYERYKSQLENPVDLRSITEKTLPNAQSYAAVFVPGGHGAMIGIPEDKNVGKILHWAHDNDLFTITLCHGPSSLLATKLDGKNFLYAGYEMAVFPDSVDKQTPMIGYLPGKMIEGLSETLKALGAKVVNSKADDTVCLHRKLITGASPLAANALGKLAAETLLKAIK